MLEGKSGATRDSGATQGSGESKDLSKDQKSNRVQVVSKRGSG